MTDIVEKLRSTQDNWNIPTAVVLDLQTAADEIVATRAERQRAQEACEQIAKRKDAEIERLRAALEKIAIGDIDRPRATIYRSDGKPSKYDKCQHDRAMWEDCDQCVWEFARKAMKGET